MMMASSERARAALSALVVLTLAVAVVPAAAQSEQSLDVPDYLTITDDGQVVMSPLEAARWALERNTDLQVQATSVEEALGQLHQAWAGDGLTANLQAGAMLLGPVSSIELPAGEGQEPISIQIGQDYSVQGTLSVTKPIYTGGRAELAVDLAEEGVTASRLGTDVARLSVALGAQELGYGLLRAMQLAGVAAAQVTAIAEHARQAQALEDAGVAPHFDVVQANTELARAQEGLISAQTAIEQIKAQLRRLLALPPDSDLSLTDPPPPVMPEGELPDLIDQALNSRPEVRAAEAGVRIARAGLALAERELAPSVALTGSLTGQTASGFGGNNYSWQVGVVATKPLIDGGARRGKIEAAQAKLRAAELQLRSTRETTALGVVQQYLAIAEAREKIAAAQQGVEEARERRRMSQLRYREGLAAGIEVLDADTALAAAEASLVNAQYDLQLAVIRLRTALGIMDVPQQEVESQ